LSSDFNDNKSSGPAVQTPSGTAGDEEGLIIEEDAHMSELAQPPTQPKSSNPLLNFITH
jgi:hypothetical protein